MGFVLSQDHVPRAALRGLFDSVARLKDQVTGFNLLGFEGQPVVESTTEGPRLGSCQSGWTASSPVVGAPKAVSGGVYATHSGITHLISAA